MSTTTAPGRSTGRPPSRIGRGLIIALLVAAVAVGGVYAFRALWSTAKATFAYDHCTIGNFELDTAQAAVASTMVGAVTRYHPRIPERAAVLVLAAGLQESKLTNLPPGSGDRDSVGVLQQRPSQGWGNYKAAPLTDVGEATKEFLDALVKVPRWRSLPLARAVQDVQISADGSAYAAHEPEAKALANALQGHRPAGISCSFAAPTEVASASTVAAQAGKQLGIQTPRAVGGTVRVPGAGWQTASWFVANADRLGIEQVAFDGKRWTRSAGWTPAAESAAVVVATMYQL